METSDALDLEKGVFRRGSARAIASSLKRSAERSKRRKSAPFRSATIPRVRLGAKWRKIAISAGSKDISAAGPASRESTAAARCDFQTF